MKTQELALVLNQEKRYFIYNIMGDEFLLNFDVKFQRQFIISQSCEIIELPWQPSVRLNAKIALTKF